MTRTLKHAWELTSSCSTVRSRGTWERTKIPGMETIHLFPKVGTIYFKQAPVQDQAADPITICTGFPESDLLKMLQSRAATLYTERGLMSTAAHPKDPLTGAAIPSMIQALDGSALIALGELPGSQ